MTWSCRLPPSEGIGAQASGISCEPQVKQGLEDASCRFGVWLGSHSTPQSVALETQKACCVVVEDVPSLAFGQARCGLNRSNGAADHLRPYHLVGPEHELLAKPSANESLQIFVENVRRVRPSNTPRSA